MRILILFRWSTHTHRNISMCTSLDYLITREIYIYIYKMFFIYFLNLKNINFINTPILFIGLHKSIINSLLIHYLKNNLLF